jgi:zinc protease
MLDRSLPPPAGEISQFEIIQAQTDYLSSGVPVHRVEAGKHEILLIECIFRSGKWYENIPGISFFSSRMMHEGSENMNAEEIADFFESHGARVEIHTGADLVTFEVYVLKKHFAKVISVFKDLFFNPVYPARELEIMKEIQIQQIRVNEKKNNIRAGKEFRKLLFGEFHPYGRSLEIQNIEKYITVENCRNYYQSVLLSGLEIIISGNLDSGIIQSLEIFSEIPPVTPTDIRLANPSSDLSEIRIPVKDSSQTSIRYGRKIIGKDHQDYLPLVVLNELLGGFFGSRLMKNLREEKGFTYGIHSSLVHHLQDSYWVVGTDVKKEFASDAFREIKHEFARLKEDPVDSDELNMVCNYLKGNFLSGIETSFSLAEKFKNIHFFNLGYQHYDDYLHILQTISASRIQELANLYLNEEGFRLVMVG